MPHPPESQRGHSLKIIQGQDFAGGMPAQGQRQVRLFNTGAVVTHPDQFCPPTLLDLHIDARGPPGIQGIFNQLFNNRSRTFYHLPPGSNLVGKPGGDSNWMWGGISGGDYLLIRMRGGCEWFALP